MTPEVAPMKRLLMLLLCLALSTAVLSACGSDGDTDSESGSTPAAPTATGVAPTETSAGPSAGGTVVEVSMKDIEYVPKDATAKVGDTVKWTNNDAVAHTVTATSGADFDSGTLEAGATYEQKVAKAGTIDYVCTIHPNQKGKITVK